MQFLQEFHPQGTLRMGTVYSVLSLSQLDLQSGCQQHSSERRSSLQPDPTADRTAERNAQGLGEAGDPRRPLGIAQGCRCGCRSRAKPGPGQSRCQKQNLFCLCSYLEPARSRQTCVEAQCSPVAVTSQPDLNNELRQSSVCVCKALPLLALTSLPFSCTALKHGPRSLWGLNHLRSYFPSSHFWPSMCCSQHCPGSLSNSDGATSLRCTKALHTLASAVERQGLSALGCCRAAWAGQVLHQTHMYVQVALLTSALNSRALPGVKLKTKHLSTHRATCGLLRNGA